MDTKTNKQKKTPKNLLLLEVQLNYAVLYAMI